MKRKTKTATPDGGSVSDLLGAKLQGQVSLLGAAVLSNVLDNMLSSLLAGGIFAQAAAVPVAADPIRREPVGFRIADTKQDDSSQTDNKK